MPRMRLIKEAYDYIKEQDPNTCLTLTAFKRLVNIGEIPYISIGRKRLVNLDLVDKYFSQGHPQDEKFEPLSLGKIRAVKL